LQPHRRLLPEYSDYQSSCLSFGQIHSAMLDSIEWQWGQSVESQGQFRKSEFGNSLRIIDLALKEIRV